MSGSLTHSGGENVSGIPGTCATRNFTHLAKGRCTRADTNCTPNCDFLFAAHTSLCIVTTIRLDHEHWGTPIPPRYGDDVLITKHYGHKYIHILWLFDSIGGNYWMQIQTILIQHLTLNGEVNKSRICLIALHTLAGLKHGWKAYVLHVHYLRICDRLNGKIWICWLFWTWSYLYIIYCLGHALCSAMIKTALFDSLPKDIGISYRK